jgi:hypothetical protein
MTPQSRIEARLNHPQSQQALRTAQVLAGCYLGISMLTLAAIILLRNNADLAPAPVWVRGVIVVVHACVLLLFAVWTARGSRRGYLLLRLASAIMVVAIAVILALPGDFPLWFKVEQGVCGLLLLGVVVIVNGKRLRWALASK